MAISSDLPEVKILSAFKPGEYGATPLEYPNLVPQIGLQQAYEGERWGNFERYDEGDIHVDDSARALAMFYMLKTSNKLGQASTLESQNLWAERFTEASIELYGAPETAQLPIIAGMELMELNKGRNHSAVDQDLWKSVSKVYEWVEFEHRELARAESDEVLKPEDVDAWKDLLCEQTPGVLEFVDDLPDDAEISPAEAFTLLANILDKLKSQDNKWEDWRVEERDANNHYVEGDDKVIVAGKNRLPATKQQMIALIAHEILGHAQRSVNGHTSEDSLIRTALPGYLTAEEGVGVFNEFCLTGVLNERVRDDYFDVALALNMGAAYLHFGRSVLKSFALKRAQLRDQIKGVAHDPEEAERKVNLHVDRIFRGTPGTNGIEKPAVFTKDIVYYDGLTKMRKFIAQKRGEGKSMKEIYDYIMQAKFDPTNERHARYMAERGAVLL